MNAQGAKMQKWLPQIGRLSALGGGVLWLALLRVPLQDGGLDAITRLLLLAVLVVAPLALALTLPEPRIPLIRVVTGLQPLAALGVIASYRLPVGPVAGGLVVGWLLLTGLAVVAGLPHFWRQGGRLEEACALVGLVFWPVGAVWLLLARLGFQPMGFSPTIVLLTAVHFHYAGFTALVLLAQAGRWLRVNGGSGWAGPAFRYAAAGGILGTPLVAAGITGLRTVEVVGALFLASALIVLAVLTLGTVAPRLRSGVARALLMGSALAVIFTMGLAAAYALGNATGRWSLSIPQMVQGHGWGNAGFVLAGLLGWVVEARNAERRT